MSSPAPPCFRVLLLVLVASSASSAWSQAVQEAGAYDVTVRFVGYTPNDPLDPDQGIEERLLEFSFFKSWFTATSLFLAEPLTSSLVAPLDRSAPLSNRTCMQVHAVDPETGLPGVAYGFKRTRQDLPGVTYWFRAVDAAAVSPYGDPDAVDCETDPESVPALIEECPSLATLTFVEESAWEDNDPHEVVLASVRSAEVRAEDAVAIPPQLAGLARALSTTSTVRLPTRSDMELQLRYSAVVGTDPTLDTFRFQGMGIADGPTRAHADDAFSQPSECDRFERFFAPISVGGDEADHCSVRGELELIGEVPICAGSQMFLTGGPGGSKREAVLAPAGTSPCDTPSLGPYLLRNTLCDTHGRLHAEQRFRDGRVFLKWPLVSSITPVPGPFGPGLDMGTTFVSPAGHMMGELHLYTGVPAFDGFRYLTEAVIDAIGARLGEASESLGNVGRFDGASGDWSSDYDLLVAAPNGETWQWEVDNLLYSLVSHPLLLLDSSGIEPQDYFNQTSVSFDLGFGADMVEMGGAPVTHDLSICHSRVTIDFLSNTPFRSPSVTFGIGGTAFTGMTTTARGLPQRTETRSVTRGVVQGLVPEGNAYTLSASVKALNGGTVSVPMACDLDVGCGQDIYIEGTLTLNVEAGGCADQSDGAASVTIKASTFDCEGEGADDVTLLYWENLTTGATEVICSGSCVGDFEFLIDDLAPCTNDLRVIAIDNATPPNESSVDFSAKNDAEAPFVEGGCPSQLMGADAPELPWNDNCPEELKVTYDPPLEDLPDGLYAVTSTAFDGCQSEECDFLYVLVSNEPPVCEAGSDDTFGCDGFALEATASDPDGDPLSTEWTSSCPDTVFEPAADVLEPFVLLGDTCDLECLLTLRVTDPDGASCESDVLVRVLDDAAPLLTLPADQVVECPAPTEPEDTGHASATDSCNAVSLMHADVTTALCGNTYSVERTWTATDACGNASSDVQLVELVDTLPPQVTALLEPAEALPPLSPASPLSVCSAPTSRRFLIRFSAEDACDEEPSVEAQLLITQHELTRDGDCLEILTRVAVEWGQEVELRLVASPCDARQPRSAKPPTSVTSEGLLIVTAECVVLEATSIDACGNEGMAVDDPTAHPSVLGERVLEDGTVCPALAKAEIRSLRRRWGAKSRRSRSPLLRSGGRR